MFTQVQRAGYLGASDMPYVMNPKEPAQLLAWWERKVGLRDAEPPNYAMQLGSFLGDFILDQYEQLGGYKITRRQEVVPSPHNNRLRATLDGFDESRGAVIEAKFASPFLDREQIFKMYYPQVALQMHCCDAVAGFLVVAQGTSEPYEIACIRDPITYEPLLLDEAAAMLESMDMLQPPVTIETPVMVPPEKWRTVDLDVDKPNWAQEMQMYLDAYAGSAAAADVHEDTGKAAKALVPDDVGKVITTFHIINRTKRGLTITRRKS
jgi:hypothetical protein